MIGIFDSGSGGLTVLRKLREVLPRADVVYFGDIANAPYGSKSHAELSALTVHAIQFLQSRGATSIVSACNSVSASLAISLFDIFSLAPTQLVEMVGPTVVQFRDSEARILLCATPATIQSEIYQQAFQMIGKHIAAVPLPELAGAIEFGASREEIRKIVQNGFEDLPLSRFDVLILACTHYPLVREVFEALCEPAGVVVYDPAEAVAARAQTLFADSEQGSGTTTFCITKDSQPFRKLVAELFPHSPTTVEVVQ